MPKDPEKHDRRTWSPTLHNRKARHNYHVLQAVEAGIALQGTEVKSIRNSEVSLDEAFARIENGEVWLIGCHINPYPFGDIKRLPDPNRPRKLLLHRRQIATLIGSVAQRGTTLVPLSMYFKDGRVKVELALCRGKQQFDKRADLRKKEQKREIDQAMRRRR
ncbi:MAG: SsrA-binding protein SmpB [Phycisphaerae bacterium]|nr:SsrA-binding protein SmpB [Phycisphaerae bacterium]